MHSLTLLLAEEHQRALTRRRVDAVLLGEESDPEGAALLQRMHRQRRVVLRLRGEG